MMDPNDPDMAIAGSISSMCECEYGPDMEECMKQKAEEAAKLKGSDLQPAEEIGADPVIEGDPSPASKPGAFSSIATAAIVIASAMMLSSGSINLGS